MDQFEPAVSEVDIRENFRDELMRALTETQTKGAAQLNAILKITKLPWHH
jgi:hypothetical protein